MTVLLPVITGVVSVLSFLLMLRDVDNWKREGGTGEKQIPVSLWIYAALAVTAVMAAAVLYPRLYPQQPVWVGTKRLILLAVMWPLAYIDFRTYRIPNSFILFGILCRAVILSFELLLDNPMLRGNLISEAVAAGALLLAALLCALIVKNGLGFGDMKLFLVMGLMLGLEGIWSAMFLSLLLSFVSAVILLIAKKKTRKDAIPFGPALVLGTYLSVILSGM